MRQSSALRDPVTVRPAPLWPRDGVITDWLSTFQARQVLYEVSQLSLGKVLDQICGHCRWPAPPFVDIGLGHAQKLTFGRDQCQLALIFFLEHAGDHLAVTQN